MTNQQRCTRWAACALLLALCETGLSQDHLTWFEDISIPLFLNASDPKRESFVRIVNHSERSVSRLGMTAVDDAGNRFGPLTYGISGNSVIHFNSGDLEDRLREEFGHIEPEGDWRLVLAGYSDSDNRGLEIQSYIRTRDGFVTSMHDIVGTYLRGEGLLVTLFNPASNTAQRSRLRLTNPYDIDMEVTIIGTDDQGMSPGSDVRLMVPSGASRTVTSEELESGTEGLDGALGDGVGKWRLIVKSGKRLQVMSLLESPTGHLTNLSSTDLDNTSTGSVLPLMLASGPSRQGFVRVLNLADQPRSLSVVAVDDAGRSFPVIEFQIVGNGALSFNSDDLEESIGADPRNRIGDWRLNLRGVGPWDARAYVRTADGFVTGVRPDQVFSPVRNARLAENRYLYVPFFNPGSNQNQRSILRLVNLSADEAKVTIVGVDDHGLSPEAGVRITVPGGHSQTFTASELELGSSAFDGQLGNGLGKWRLFVIPEDSDVLHSRDLAVMSLLESPTGHLTSLGTRGNGSLYYRGLVWQPQVLGGHYLKEAILEILGKEPSHILTWLDLAELRSLDLSGRDCFVFAVDDRHPDPACTGSFNDHQRSNGRGQIKDLSGIHFAYQLESLNLSRTFVSDLRPLALLPNLRELDLGYNLIGDLSPLANIRSLTKLNLRSNYRRIEIWGGRRYRVDGIEELGPLAELSELTSLALSNNDIEDLTPLAGLNNLATLELSNNGITDLTPLSGLLNLSSLALNSNMIADLTPLSGLLNLSSLALNSNMIADLTPLSGLLSLSSLALNSNMIADLTPLSGLDLTVLSLSNNEVVDLTPLSSMVNLSSLFLSNNEVVDLTSLSGLVNLSTLGLARNDVADLTPLSGLLRLSSLWLEGNEVSGLTALSGLSKLGSLTLSSNHVSELGPLSGLTRLQYLNLSENNISDLLPLSDLDLLVTLDLSKNNVSDLSPLTELVRLERLDLSGNRISELEPLSKLVNLTELDLSSNSISDLSPLNDNIGLGEDDVINLRFNPVFDSDSYDRHIPALLQRGVVVDYRPPDGDNFPVSRLNALFDEDIVIVETEVPENNFRIWHLVAEYTRDIYTEFEDVFDFIIFLLPSDYLHLGGGYVSTNLPTVRYFPVTNDTDGIGLQRFYRNEYGSAGRLRGVITLGGSEWLGRPAMLHIMMHSWANYLDLGQQPYYYEGNGVLGFYGNIHWGISSANGILGGFDIEKLVDRGAGLYTAGRFSEDNGASVYSPIELYLAGLVPAEEVPDLWVARQGVLDRGSIETNGGFTTYTFEDIVERHGERAPSAADARHDYRGVLVVLSESPDALDEDRLRRVSEGAAWFSHPGEDANEQRFNFFEATGGRGTITFGELSQFRKLGYSAPRGLPRSFGELPQVNSEFHRFYSGGAQVRPD